jgi:tetratricopeptide (TPR) repeat protein
MPRDTPRSESSDKGHASMSAPIQIGVFRREGEYWSVGSAGTPVRLKDSRGLAYIAYLLRHPGTEFHALDLVGGIGSESDEKSTARLGLSQENLEQGGFHIGGLGDAGEVLDEQAKRAYRQRLSELREELEEAKALDKVERADELEAEIDALTRELARGVGLAGRSRRAASASERARQTVTKAIRAVMDRIVRSDAELGSIFSRSIKTGTFCSYQPSPESPIKWEFAAATEPPQQSISGAKSAPAKPSSAALEFLPFSTARRTAFVGRENESRAIQAAIAHAQAGRGSLIMLGGGPGVGKTRLAIEMAESAAHSGFACFLGRCNERDEPFPFLPFVQIIETMLARAPSLDAFRTQIAGNAPELVQLVPSLRRVLPDVPEPMELPEPQKRRYIFQSVAEALGRAARTRPHVLILDDLHWADESTLALLTHLTNHMGQLPLAIIGTYRDEYSEDNPALARTLEELIRQGVRPLKLAGLSKDSVARMLEELSQHRIVESLVNAIFEESNGNPFFVEEVYRHLLEEGEIFDSAGRFRTDLQIDEIDVPENVRLILARRLKRFSDSEMHALSAAAVIGRSFSFQLLTAISQMDIDELFAAVEKGQRMGIIVPSAEGPEKPFTFAHELVRQTLLAEMSIVRRQQLHAKVAAALESLDPTSAKENAGEISDHLVKAGSFANREAVIRWATDAGNAALEVSAFEEARVSFESALSRVGQTEERRRAELLYRLGIAKRGLGRWSEARDVWEQTLEIFTVLGDQESIARTCLRFAEGATWSGKQREAFAIAERLLAKLTTVSSDRAFLLATLALGKLDDDEPDAAHEVFTAAFAVAEELSDARVKAAILAFRSKLNFVCLRLHEALEDSLRSAELLTPSAAWIRAEQLLWYKAILLQLGRMQEADNVGQELEPLASRIGHLPALSSCRRTSAWIQFWRHPNVAQLEDKMRGDLDVQTESGLNPFFMSAAQLSTAEFLSGKWDQALRHAESAWSPEAPHHVQAMNIAVRFRPLAYSGDREVALALMNSHRELVGRAGKTNIYGSWMLLLAAIEGLFVLGEREQAAALYPVVRELIDTGTVCIQILSRFPRTVAGISAAAARNWNVAEEHFRIGLEQAEAFPNQLEQTEIRRFHAMMLLDRGTRGDRREARKLLNETLESYRRIGMRRHVELTLDLLSKVS